MNALHIVMPGGSVQEAINRAKETEIVYILPGVHTGKICLRKGIALKGLPLTYPEAPSGRAESPYWPKVRPTDPNPDDIDEAYK